MDSAALITRYLSSKRPFFNSFNSYLTDILNVLTEQSTQIRTKALKCMTMIVNEDPDVLLKSNMQNAVQYSLKDASTMVREAAVDLIGKFILHKQELVTQYYRYVKLLVQDSTTALGVSRGQGVVIWRSCAVIWKWGVMGWTSSASSSCINRNWPHSIIIMSNV